MRQLKPLNTTSYTFYIVSRPVHTRGYCFRARHAVAPVRLWVCPKNSPFYSNPLGLMGTGNYSATSNSLKLVHWPLILLLLVCV